MLRKCSSRDSIEYKQFLAELHLCHNAISAYEQKESKIRSGRILKPLAQQVFAQVRNATQGNYNAEMAYVQKHDANYARATEMLYNKEQQTETGKQNVATANSSILLLAFDKKISEVHQEVKGIESNLSKLGWCLSREKRTLKKSLTDELNDRKNYLNNLQSRRRLWTVIRY